MMIFHFPFSRKSNSLIPRTKPRISNSFPPLIKPSLANFSEKVPTNVIICLKKNIKNVGGCHKGAECTFSHDFQPEKIKILCKYFLGGACNKPNCAFSHNLSEFPCKFFHVLGTCDAGTFCQ